MGYLAPGLSPMRHVCKQPTPYLNQTESHDDTHTHTRTRPPARPPRAHPRTSAHAHTRARTHVCTLTCTHTPAEAASAVCASAQAEWIRNAPQRSFEGSFAGAFFLVGIRSRRTRKPAPNGRRLTPGRLRKTKQKASARVPVYLEAPEARMIW